MYYAPPTWRAGTVTGMEGTQNSHIAMFSYCWEGQVTHMWWQTQVTLGAAERVAGSDNSE